MKRVAFCWWLIVVGLGLSPASAPAQSTETGQSVAGIDLDRLRLIDGMVAEAVAAGEMPGCVVCAGRQSGIVFLRAYGDRQLLPTVEPMTTDTIFDLASLTKPVATATSIMMLVDRGQLGLDDRVASFFPAFGVHGKEVITVRDLLLHRSGLIADNPLDDYLHGPDVAWTRICELPLVDPVGSRFRYSDVNFIVLGELVRKVSGVDFDQFVAEQLLEPLQMKDSGFNPPESLRLRTAPTERREGEWIRGTVHDPRAFALDGVAGHAGLFSTASDLSLYARMMLGGGQIDGGSNSIPPVLSRASIEVMTAGYRSGDALRGLGWDRRSGYSSNRGDWLSDAAFGHGGFTGTVLWIDPGLDLFVLFLSSRLHPDGTGSVNRLAGRIANVVAGAVSEPFGPGPLRSPVRTGIDVLQQNDFRQLEGKRTGLITNQTGRNAAGVSTAKLLADAPNVQLTALFSPEHGFAGQLDKKNVDDSVDPETGIRVFSLYGENRRPTPEMLQGIDALVFDIQDVGTRFYTYTSTMGEAMVAAADAGCEFIVLDRPNPINGVDVAGPMLDPGSESFVGWHSLPVRHGMTVGEMAQMFRDERGLKLKLEVIECEGWRREEGWERTGLVWVNPSPNMRSVTQALLYPGIGLLEMTNVSVGRATDTPFEIVGAPWINSRLLASELNRLNLRGVDFVPVGFTPVASRFAGELCHGINLVIANREEFDPVSVGLAIAVVLKRLHADQWESQHLLRLLGNEQAYRGLLAGEDEETLCGLSREGLAEFMKRRQKYLIYKQDTR